MAAVTDTARWTLEPDVDVDGSVGDPPTASTWTPSAPPIDEGAARRALRTQIARLEQDLADAFATAFPHTEVDVRVPGPARRGPRLLDLGELEHQRDALQDRLRDTRARLEVRGLHEERARIELERMLLDPRRHRFARLHREDIGQGGCGAYQVRPRLGVIGMLAGWWHVKLSSGCPLATS